MNDVLMLGIARRHGVRGSFGGTATRAAGRDGSWLRIAAGACVSLMMMLMTMDMMAPGSQSERWGDVVGRLHLSRMPGRERGDGPMSKVRAVCVVFVMVVRSLVYAKTGGLAWCAGAACAQVCWVMGAGGAKLEVSSSGADKL